eukprot:TRINITY_DN16920_c0_g1_i1.p1 TRINITY_DN16920_c0_g1~~TRINITY_DN16920_c0_g1_i1.p1  ORF type:complete len:425 (+),score=57.81 TRINITY_DN16920_c0_g1_i1:24-1298(+)
MRQGDSIALGKSPMVPPPPLPRSRSYVVHGSPFEVYERYDIIKPLGYGAFGIVCAAHDRVTGENVAIKKMPKLFDDLAEAKRVLRELKLLAFMNHENVVSVIDVLRPRQLYFDDIYFATELMDADLHQLLRSKQPLTEEHIVYFIYQIFRALKYLHSCNILHRDLKPGNILVNANCDLRICDFGLARGCVPEEDAEQCLTDYVVTRWYRPPELLLMGNAYGPAVDIWSAGCICAELFTRKPLFPGKNYIQQLNLITDVIGSPEADDLAFVHNADSLMYLQSMAKKEPVPLELTLPTVPHGAVKLIESILTFAPAKRASAAQVLEHPYLSQLHDPTDEPASAEKFVWEYDSKPLTERELRALFWDEIRLYHPDEPVIPDDEESDEESETEDLLASAAKQSNTSSFQRNSSGACALPPLRQSTKHL